MPADKFNYYRESQNKPEELAPMALQLQPDLMIHKDSNQVVEVVHFTDHRQKFFVREWVGPAFLPQIRWESLYGNHLVKFPKSGHVIINADQDLEFRYHLPATGLELIAVERHRQQSQEGWDQDHDSQHTDGSLAAAAACYANMAAGLVDPDYDKDFDDLSHDCWRGAWPQSWADSWWKPSPDPLVNLRKAGALIAAEMDRVLRERASRAGGKTVDTFDITYKPVAGLDLKFTGKLDDTVAPSAPEPAAKPETLTTIHSDEATYVGTPRQIHISEVASYQVPPSGDPEALRQVLEHPDDFSFIHVSVPAGPEGTSGEGFFKAMLDSINAPAPPPTKPTRYWPTARWTVEYQPSAVNAVNSLPFRPPEIITCLNGHLTIEGHFLVFKELQSQYVDDSLTTFNGSFITKLMIHQDEVARVTPHIDELEKESAEIKAEWDRWHQWERERREQQQQRGVDKETLKADLRQQIAEAAKAQGAIDKIPSKPMPPHAADFMQDTILPQPAPPRNYRAVPRSLANDRSNED